MAFLQKIKRQSGITYRIRYRLNGKEYAKYLPLGTTQQESKAILSKFDHEIALHKAGIQAFHDPLEKKTPTMTIKDFIAWFSENKKTAIRRGKEVSSTTMKMYDRSFRFLINWIGNIPISEIGNHLSEIEENLKQYKKSASRSAYIRSLRSAWKFGIERGVISDNPFTKIEISKQNSLPDILTIEEKDRMYEQLTDEQAKVAFLLARYAGLRREEICRNIRWEDIYWDQDLINIPEGKTGEKQKVPMIPELKERLSGFKKHEGFVVSSHPVTVTHKFTEAKRRAGINKRGAIHILRHSLGSDLRSQGLDIRDIQDLLRHSSIATTQIYTQLSKQALRKKLKGKSL